MTPEGVFFLASIAPSYEKFSLCQQLLDETKCETWLAEESVQAAVKYLLKRLHKQKMFELYETYFEKAKSDVQAFKAFTEFSEKFFGDEGEDELRSILNKMKISEDE